MHSANGFCINIFQNRREKSYREREITKSLFDIHHTNANGKICKRVDCKLLWKCHNQIHEKGEKFRVMKSLSLFAMSFQIVSIDTLQCLTFKTQAAQNHRQTSITSNADGRPTIEKYVTRVYVKLIKLNTKRIMIKYSINGLCYFPWCYSRWTHAIQFANHNSNAILVEVVDGGASCWTNTDET